MNNDGVINADDRYRSDSNTDPKIQFGLYGNVDYKGFDLSFLFQGQTAAKKRLSNEFYLNVYNSNSIEYVVQNSWIPSNPDAELPRVHNNENTPGTSDFWYFDATYVRLKTLELGYTFPTTLINKAGFSNLRIYLGAYNLFTFLDKMKGLDFGDPEFTNSMDAGYPNIKTVSFGINVTL